MTERTDPPPNGDERTQLLAFLDYQRATLRQKAGNLDAAQLDTVLSPSAMTLGGMVKHLAFVEHWWLHDRFLGAGPVEPWTSVDWKADWDWDWHSAKDDSPEQLWALYEEMVADADSVIAGAQLDDLVEEYARHNGHADLIRESIDGLTGD